MHTPNDYRVSPLNIPINTISQITGLSAEEIQGL